MKFYVTEFMADNSDWFDIYVGEDRDEAFAAVHKDWDHMSAMDRKHYKNLQYVVWCYEADIQDGEDFNDMLDRVYADPYAYLVTSTGFTAEELESSEVEE